MTMKTVAALLGGALMLGTLLGGPALAQDALQAAKSDLQKRLVELHNNPCSYRTWGNFQQPTAEQAEACGKWEAAAVATKEPEPPPCASEEDDGSGYLQCQRMRKTALGREAGDIKTGATCPTDGDKAKVVSMDLRTGWVTYSMLQTEGPNKVPVIKTVTLPLLKSPANAKYDVRTLTASQKQLDQSILLKKLNPDMPDGFGHGMATGPKDVDAEPVYTQTMMSGAPFGDPPTTVCWAERAETFAAIPPFEEAERERADKARIAEAEAKAERDREAAEAAKHARKQARIEAEKQAAQRRAELERKKEEIARKKEEALRLKQEREETAKLTKQELEAAARLKREADATSKAAAAQAKAEKAAAEARAKLNAVKPASKAARPVQGVNPDAGRDAETTKSIRPTGPVNTGSAASGTTSVARVDQGWTAPVRARRAPPPQPREDYDTEAGTQ